MFSLLALLLCSGAAFSAESGTRAKGACLLVNAALRSRAQQQPRPPSPRSSFRSSTRSAQDAGRLRAPFLPGRTSTAAARCESCTAVACPLTPAPQGAVRLSHAKLERLGLGEEEKYGRSPPAASRPHSCLRQASALFPPPRRRLLPHPSTRQRAHGWRSGRRGPLGVRLPPRALLGGRRQRKAGGGLDTPVGRGGQPYHG